jgi:hypothetical protein
MARFKLLAGQHVQADKSKPLLHPDGKPTGFYERATFNAGQIVESDRDLVADHGNQKFELIGGDEAAAHDRIAQLEAELATVRAQQAGDTTPGDPTPRNLTGSPSVAPGGQVSTGYQQTSGGREVGVPHSGPVSPEMAAQMQGRQTGQQTGQQPPKPGQQATPKGAPPSPHKGRAPEQLENMTVKELHDYAASEEIELHGAKTRDELLKAIKAAH